MFFKLKCFCEDIFKLVESLRNGNKGLAKNNMCYMNNNISMKLIVSFIVYAEVQHIHKIYIIKNQ